MILYQGVPNTSVKTRRVTVVMLFTRQSLTWHL